jgi:hypothetical protein
MTSTVDIRGAGRSWQVVVQGTPLPRRFTTYGCAAIRANQIELHREPKERPCICCSRSFPSSGPGNRMCYECRRFASGAML